MADVPRTTDPHKAADPVMLNGTVHTMDRGGTTRTAPDARYGRVPALDVDTALRACTSQAAHLGFEEQERGSPEAGKYADVTVFSAGPGTVEPASPGSLEVDATVLGGELVRSGPGRHLEDGCPAGHGAGPVQGPGTGARR